MTSKKMLLVVLLVVACVATIVNPAQAVFITAGGSTVFQDDFENGTVGNPPGPASVGSWSIFNPGNGTVDITNAASPGAFQQGTQYMEFDRTGDIRAFANFSSSQPKDTVLHAEAMVYVPTGGDECNMMFESDTGIGGAIRTRATGVVEYLGSTWASSTLTITHDKWQKWEIDYAVGATGAGAFTFAIDGVVFSGVGSSYVLVPSSVTRLNFTSNGGDGTSYFVDAVDAVPEPSTLVLLASGLIGLLCYAWRKRK